MNQLVTFDLCQGWLHIIDFSGALALEGDREAVRDAVRDAALSALTDTLTSLNADGRARGEHA